MFTSAFAFVLSILIAALLTPVVRDLALRRGLVDPAGGRKIHQVPTPRLGGVAIVLAFYAPLTFLFFYQTQLGQIFWRDYSRASGLFVGGLAIAVLGFVDDVKGLGARSKFFWQFSVAALMYYMGFQVNVVANPFGGALELGWVGFPFTLLWIVGIINALNLVDGLDGLAAGVGLFATSTIFVIAYTHGDAPLMLFTAALMGALIGFLFYNFNPATIFMGDTGSMFIGFILATTSIKSAQKSSTAVALLIPIVTLGLPILDTLLAIARRAVAGKPLFSADKDHIHHRLLTLGLSHRQAALALYAVCLLLAAAAWLLTRANSGQAAVILAWLFVMSYLFIRKLGYVQFQGQVLFEERRRNHELLGIEGNMAVADEEFDVARWWHKVKTFAGEVEAHEVSLSLDLPHGEGETVTTRYHAELGSGEQGPIRLKFDLNLGLKGSSYLELVWRDGRSEIDPEIERATLQLRDSLVAGLVKRGVPPLPGGGE